MKSYLIHRYSLLLLRVALSSIFIVAALNHLLSTETVVKRLESAWLAETVVSLSSAAILVRLSGFFMLLGGVAILLGFKTRLAAWGLLLILIPITLTIQVGQWATVGPLFKNIVILGALLFFAINGALCCSVDHSPLFQHKNTNTLKS